MNKNDYGSRAAKYWLPFLNKMNREIPVEYCGTPESWLAGVCYAANGNVDEIKKIIELLPMKKTEETGPIQD